MLYCHYCKTSIPTKRSRGARLRNIPWIINSIIIIIIIIIIMMFVIVSIVFSFQNVQTAT